ncbi:MAG: DUF1549 domain-containing protein, partial [Luteolibacter sp.]
MHISYRSIIGVISAIAVGTSAVWFLRDKVGNSASANSIAAKDSDNPHGSIEFNRDIRPILNRSCTGCHGGVKKNAGVSFIERREALAVSSEGNPIIIPGDPWNSELVKRITAKDPQIIMPPAGGEHQHDPLSQDEIDKIIEWIRQGAEWQDHWAYLAPKDIAVEVKNEEWIRQPLDRHVLARLESLGLTPTVEASKAQWLRRASLDLTGLPPTPEELDAFLSDSSPDAYESFVDRMLESPRYGERWAAMWMDLARYADTYGFEKDPHRNSWPYRQWLIEAFNRDIPYTKFVSDQIAGDLAEQADVDQWIATLFQRMTKTNTEGGTDDEQFRVEAVMDRISTTWQVFQGITMGCVQCHDHPYEPIPHEDYYHSMYFFNNSEDCDLDNDFPHMLLANETGARQSAIENQEKLSQLREQRNHRGAIWIDRDPTWLQPAVAEFEISAGELIFTDGVFQTTGTQPPHTHYRIHLHSPTESSLVTALKITILPDENDPAKAPFRGSVLSHLELHHLSADGTSSPLPVSWVYADALAGPHFPEDSL